MENTNIIYILIILLVLSSATFLYIDWSGDSMSAIEDIRHNTNPFESDTDRDGLTDYEEIKFYGTDATDNDTDNDRLDDYAEVKIHNSNPHKSDTNDNGLNDYIEASVYAIDPTDNDTDNDGLNDYEEIKVYDTDPANNDTDNDRLNDFDEIKKYDTDPTIMDTNNDGLNDYEEVKIYGTDPTIMDTNNDGLNDYEEVKIYGTDPIDNDSDNDKLSDFNEINVYESDPNSNDSDNDGLNDYEEIEIHNTNVNNPDTSNNGLNDSMEVKLGTDPLVWDSSGDGLPDGYKYHKEKLDVKKLNVVVEVDRTKYSKNTSSLNLVSDQFASAPVKSNFGEKGINLVIRKNNRIVSDKKTVNLIDYTTKLYDKREMKNSGSYHALFSRDVRFKKTEQSINGITRKNIDGMLIQTKNMSNKDVASTFMHELGHQLGLWPSVFERIDSSKYNRSEYPSVMNYNKPSCSYKEVQNNVCENRVKLEYTESEWEYIGRNLNKVVPR
jgi:hypothetical protein